MPPTPNDDDPRLRFSRQPARPPSPDQPAPPPAPDEATVRFGTTGPIAGSSADRAAGTPETTVRLGGAAGSGDPDAGTVLDPDVWPSQAPYGAAPAAGASAAGASAAGAPSVGATASTGGLRRFGPGVPGPDTSAGTAHTAAVWHGTVRPGEPVLSPGGGKGRGRRALRGWLLPVVVLLAVLAFLAWQRFPASVRVDGVAVRDSAAVQGCHSTAEVIGTLRTSGGAGTVRYRWRRSDGTVSDELKQHVAKGHRSTDVTLLWTFDGPGSLTATATLEVLGPQQRSASATFPYRCD
ncbi:MULTISPECIES: hypothetical protein [unclassified Streptomyces]|uniref:hypothetical protein n=1 Tax=unclassified Streptomyces TaxID=2593676 RepID=UPI00114D302F|nr:MULTISPECIES: hypothetical protein [unclassified Streptomyces]MYS20089.1 hypothetical protein [Streptomyces sp. SID4948]